MSEPRQLTDADLMAQLWRRSTSPKDQSELSVPDFVARVGTKIDAGTSPVPARRWPALAGLAGATAILLVVIVAGPRLLPAGGSPHPTQAWPPATISFTSLGDFAARVAAGELRGETVLVNARISRYEGPPLYGATCNIERELNQPDAPSYSCLLGQMDGAERPMYADADYVAARADAAANGGPAYVWRAPQPPIEGVLVLSVDEFGGVKYVGRNPLDEVASSLGEVSALDLESTPLDEIRVVPAWLTGIVAPISCAPPEPGSYIAELPGRYCGNPSWLAPDPTAVDANGYTIPGDWLQVQSNAYLDFAPAPAAVNGSAEPRAGLYVIGKRLEGGGCPNAQPPCWQWEVVGRLSINDGLPAQPFATPAPGSNYIVCGPQGAEDRPTILDQIGIVASCEVVETQVPVPDRIFVRNPDDDDHILEVHWSGTPCDIATNFTLTLVAQRAHLDGAPPDGECEASRVLHHMRVVLIEPLLAQSMSATLSEWPPAETPRPAPATPTPNGSPEIVPSPAATPDTAPPPAGTFIECAQPKAEIGAVVIDAAGLVDSCVTVEATGEGVAEDPVVRNPNGMLTELQIEWPGTPCDAAVGYTLVPGATGLSIEIGPRPDGKALGEDGVCIASGVIHAIRLQLRGRLDARNVWISRTAVPTTSIRTVSCDDSEIDIHDITGLIVSCRRTAIDKEPTDGNPLITNPVGDSSRLHVFWAFQDPSACGPQPPAIALEFKRMAFEPGFVVSTAADFVPGTGCRHVARWFGLEIELSEPVPASDVTFATVGNGTIATAKTAVGIFDLVITAEDVEYSSSESIQIYAALHYNGGDDGGDPSVELWGVGSLVNGFGIKQLDGPLVMGPGWDEPCTRHELQHRAPLRVPYEKSAAWSDDDPNAAFYRDWVNDQELRLPAGTWLVTAYSEFAIGSDCAGPLVSLQASQVIVVR